GGGARGDLGASARAPRPPGGGAPRASPGSGAQRRRGGASAPHQQPVGPRGPERNAAAHAGYGGDRGLLRVGLLERRGDPFTRAARTGPDAGARGTFG